MTEADLTPDQRLEVARDVSRQLLTKAAELRNLQFPDEDASLPVVHRALVLARVRLDQLEMVVAQAMALKAAAETNAAKLEQEEQDAWDDQAFAARNRRTEFEGAAERYAIWRIKTRDQRAAARLAREVADIAASTERRVTLMHRGLDGARLDLHRRLNAVAVMESGIERDVR